MPSDEHLPPPLGEPLAPQPSLRPASEAKPPPSSESEAAPGLDGIRDAVVRIASTVEGLDVELKATQRKQRSQDRQMIIVLGIVAVLLWRSSASLKKTAFDGTVSNGL